MSARIVITEGYRWTYFEWFILGFYKLQQKGEIELSFRLPVGSKILASAKNRRIIQLGDILRTLFESDTYNMSGYIDFPDKSERKYFTIDSADAPYLFDSQKLESVDIYFKMQCPKHLNESGFNLTDKIIIPWLDHAHADGSLKKLTARGERKPCRNFKENIHKIKPLMIGPRALSEKGFSFESLAKGYEHYRRYRNETKSKNIMCYFGNSNGPKPEEAVSSPDYDWEADIMGYFGNKINHPNEKRAIIADIVKNIENCDSRIITHGYSDTGIQQNKNLIIPLSEFCKFISQFQYNINISGYRKSIPNRFIESFMVDTAIFTDKLGVRWYQPFGSEEVTETEEMGYLPKKEIDWGKIRNNLLSLPESNPAAVEDSFNKKWEPELVARYILNEVKSS